VKDTKTIIRTPNAAVVMYPAIINADDIAMACRTSPISKTGAFTDSPQVIFAHAFVFASK
jgi:hypothetical protein